MSEGFSEEGLDVECLCHFAPPNPNMDDLEWTKRLDALIDAVRHLKTNQEDEPIAKLRFPFPVEPANLHCEVVPGASGTNWLLIDCAEAKKVVQKKKL